jgi:PAS domain S-box-containing protein
MRLWSQADRGFTRARRAGSLASRVPAQGLIRNATQRQLAERLGAVLESSLDAVIAIDAAGVVTDWNPAAELLFGWAADAAVGQDLASLIIPEEHRGAHRRGMERLLGGGEARLVGRRVEVPALRRDGSTVEVELTLARIGTSPEETLFVAHVRDVTERRRSDRERERHATGLEATARESAVRLAEVSARLERTERLLQVAFRRTPVALSVTRLSTGRLVEANDAFLATTGHTRESALGRTTLELGIWEDASSRDAFLADITRDGFARNRECRFRRANGEVTTSLVSAERIEIDGEPHVFAASVEIEAQKRAEAELRRALGQEQELLRLKSRFVSMVSHEYRTPLGVIQSAAEILDAYFDRLGPERRRMHLADIRDAATTMTRLMDEVLFLERSGAGRLGCRPAPVEIGPFCREFLAGPGLADAAGRIRARIADGLPHAWIDAGLLRLALGNLLGNALKYSSARHAVDLEVVRNGDFLVIAVSDRGIGIPTDDLARLFEPFHRAGNVGDIQGSGLGLVIVKRCADLHGGHVGIDSREGEGATFTLSLPAFREPPAP